VLCDYGKHCGIGKDSEIAGYTAAIDKGWRECEAGC